MFSAQLPGPLADELGRTVSELHGLVSDFAPSADEEVAAVRAHLDRGDG